MFPKKVPKTTIMVFGTFDGVHTGHLDFFRQARELSPDPFLVVSVARDLNVKKIKGEEPNKKEEERVALLEKVDYVDRVVLGGDKEYLPHILKESPDIIALGYDQVAYVDSLEGDLKNIGSPIRIVKLLPYKETIYKNTILKKNQ